MAENEKENSILEELANQIQTMKERRLRWEPLWKDVMEFCCPGRSFDPVDDQDKDKKPKTNYNNRAALALTKAAAAFLGYTANRKSQWHKVGFEDQEIQKLYGVSDWTELGNRALAGAFARNGMYEALGEIGPDFLAIGTAVVYIEEINPGKIAFQARHPLSVWISENAAGDVDTVLEEIPMSNRAIRDRFGEAIISLERKDDATEKPYAMSSIMHLVKPYDEQYYPYAQKPFDKNMAYISVWWDDKDKKILDVGGYWDFPFAVGRCWKNSGEEYGRSPAQQALGDIMVSQQMRKSLLRLGNLIADPPYIVDEGLEGADTILPGGRIYRAAKTREDTIQPIVPAGNYPITKDVEEAQNRIIDEHFFLDIFMMLSTIDRSNMTAREVVELTGEKAAPLGPMVGRFEREMLQPIIMRTFGILYRSGQLPPPPDALATAKNVQIKVDFLGYIAQVLQRYYQTNGINAGLMFAAQVMQLFPEGRDWVDGDALMVEGLESSAMPAAVIREKDDVEKLRAQRIAQQQAAAEQQAAAAQDQMLAQNADKLGKKPEPGSPLDGIGQMAAQQAGAQ